MSGLRAMLYSIGCIGVLGIGYGMWVLISPDEDRRKEMLVGYVGFNDRIYQKPTQ